MTLMEGFLSGIVDDHIPLWKYVTKVKKTRRGGGNFGDESIIIILKHLMDHTQESRPISCG